MTYTFSQVNLDNHISGQIENYYNLSPVSHQILIKDDLKQTLDLQQKLQNNLLQVKKLILRTFQTSKTNQRTKLTRITKVLVHEDHGYLFRQNQIMRSSHDSYDLFSRANENLIFIMYKEFMFLYNIKTKSNLEMLNSKMDLGDTITNVFVDPISKNQIVLLRNNGNFLKIDFINKKISKLEGIQLNMAATTYSSQLCFFYEEQDKLILIDGSQTQIIIINTSTNFQKVVLFHDKIQQIHLSKRTKIPQNTLESQYNSNFKVYFQDSYQEFFELKQISDDYVKQLKLQLDLKYQSNNGKQENQNNHHESNRYMVYLNKLTQLNQQNNVKDNNESNYNNNESHPIPSSRLKYHYLMNQSAKDIKDKQQMEELLQREDLVVIIQEDIEALIWNFESEYNAQIDTINTLKTNWLMESLRKSIEKPNQYMKLCLHYLEINDYFGIIKIIDFVESSQDQIIMAFQTPLDSKQVANKVLDSLEQLTVQSFMEETTESQSSLDVSFIRSTKLLSNKKLQKFFQLFEKINIKPQLLVHLGIYYQMNAFQMILSLIRKIAEVQSDKKLLVKQIVQIHLKLFQSIRKQYRKSSEYEEIILLLIEQIEIQDQSSQIKLSPLICSLDNLY
eukprot:403370223